MDTTLHPIAIKHLPAFITAPGQTDVLFNVVAVVLVLMVFAIGNVYLRLHALPEHIAHQTEKAQLQIVAVLSLIALLTHSNLFWIAALLLAMAEIPDFVTPLNSMSRSLDTIAQRTTVVPEEPSAPVQPPAPVVQAAADATREAVSVSPAPVPPASIAPIPTAPASDAGTSTQTDRKA